MFCIGLYWENMTKFSCPKTIRHRALIFGLLHHLVDLFYACSNYAACANNGPAPGVACFFRET